MKGIKIPNHSVLRRNPSVIGTDDDALYCVTNDTTCCDTQPCDRCNCTCRGRWHFPNSKVINNCTEDNFYCTSCLTGAVPLHYRGDGRTGETGLFRCDIEGSTDPLYICIYGYGRDDFKCKVHSSCLAIEHALLST